MAQFLDKNNERTQLFTQQLPHFLNQLGFPVDNHKKLAQAVQELSDHFIQSGERSTPWAEDRFQAAYLAYFFPLNTLRLLKVRERLEGVGFFQQKPKRIVDFGAGPGTASAAFGDLCPSWQAVDIETISFEFHRYLFSKRLAVDYQTSLNKLNADDLLVCSYSLNESQLPIDLLSQADQLILVEPSTKAHSRNLLKLRQQLIDQGYFVWAPCTHQDPCPLLNQSEKDWCHDAVHTALPDWWDRIDQHLPMRNQRISFSYLALSRIKPADHTGRVRIVGDPLKQKGKTKQMICDSSERKFFALLKRQKVRVDLERGDLIQWDEGQLEKRADEVRLIEAQYASSIKKI